MEGDTKFAEYFASQEPLPEPPVIDRLEPEGQLRPDLATVYANGGAKAAADWIRQAQYDSDRIRAANGWPPITRDQMLEYLESAAAHNLCENELKAVRAAYLEL